MSRILTSGPNTTPEDHFERGWLDPGLASPERSTAPRAGGDAIASGGGIAAAPEFRRTARPHRNQLEASALVQGTCGMVVARIHVMAESY
jgi:hypothetical protein